jgi:hypothetical protein
MHVDLGYFMEFVEEHIGKILFLTGAILLLIGVLLISPLGSIECACCIFFGSVFAIFGISAQLGFFSVKIRSLTGIGTILISISVIFFITSLILIQFIELEIVGYVGQVFHGTLTHLFRPIFHMERPFLSISSLLFWTSIALFIIGIILKILHNL